MRRRRHLAARRRAGRAAPRPLPRGGPGPARPLRAHPRRLLPLLRGTPARGPPRGPADRGPRGAGAEWVPAGRLPELRDRAASHPLPRGGGHDGRVPAPPGAGRAGRDDHARPGRAFRRGGGDPAARRRSPAPRLRAGAHERHRRRVGDHERPVAAGRGARPHAPDLRRRPGWRLHAGRRRAGEPGPGRGRRDRGPRDDGPPAGRSRGRRRGAPLPATGQPLRPRRGLRAGTGLPGAWRGSRPSRSSRWW